MAVALENPTGTETYISAQHEQHGKEGKEMTADAEPTPDRPARSGALSVAIAGLALFSDGYNAQISKSCQMTVWTISNRSNAVGYMEPLFSVLYVLLELVPPSIRAICAN
jgi:hypothetical protein